MHNRPQRNKLAATHASLRAAAALLLCGGLVAGCERGRSPFEVLDLPREPVPAGAEWPRLADFPDAPPPGEFGPGAPDPAVGRATGERLRADAAAAAAEAGTLGAPVLTEAEAARLRSAGRGAAAEVAARAGGAQGG